MMRWIAFIVLLFSASMALAGSSTLSVFDGLGATQTFGVTTDIGGNLYSNYALVDGAAAGNKATVTGSNALKVDNSGVTQPVSASSLPLPTGAATSAKQPALGTAGSASTDVLSVQGIASMTPLKTDGSATTQPISAASLPLPSGASTAAGLTTINTTLGSPMQNTGGSVTANAGTNLNTSALALEAGNLAILVTDSGAPGATACATDTGSCNFNQLFQRIAQRLTTINTTLGTPLQAGGTVVANIGTSGSLALETGGNLATLAGGVSASKYQVNLASVAAALHLSTNVDQIGGTSIVTGGVAGLQAVGGPVASGGTNADNPLKVGGVFNTTQPTVTNGQVVDNQSTARGAQIVATGIDTFNVAQTGGGNTGSAVPSGAQYIGGIASGNLTGITVCDNSTPFSFSSTAAQKIITKAASKKVYICSIDISVGPATNVALIEGTKVTNECDTSTAGMAGGTTAATGWNFAANGGLTKGTGIGIVFKTANANFDVCLLASAANQVSGSIQWTQY